MKNLTKKLGFGLMRLPQKNGTIDTAQTKEMVDMFLSEGFTTLIRRGDTQVQKKQSGTPLYFAIRVKTICLPQSCLPGQRKAKRRRSRCLMTP